MTPRCERPVSHWPGGGLAAATVDAIAARSGVSKATIYKHWPARTAVVAEGFGGMMSDALPLPDTGSAVGDFTAVSCGIDHRH
jgi:AcrR family transcriptional regulator